MMAENDDVITETLLAGISADLEREILKCLLALSSSDKTEELKAKLPGILKNILAEYYIDIFVKPEFTVKQDPDDNTRILVYIENENEFLASLGVMK